MNKDAPKASPPEDGNILHCRDNSFFALRDLIEQEFGSRHKMQRNRPPNRKFPKHYRKKKLKNEWKKDAGKPRVTTSAVFKPFWLARGGTGTISVVVDGGQGRVDRLLLQPRRMRLETRANARGRFAAGEALAD